MIYCVQWLFTFPSPDRLIALLPLCVVQYGTDLQIRVFDLRMNRMVTPLPVVAPSASVTGVSCLRLVPQVDTMPLEYPALLMCTADGIVQVGCSCGHLMVAVTTVRAYTHQVQPPTFFMFRCAGQQLDRGSRRPRCPPDAVRAPE